MIVFSPSTVKAVLKPSSIRSREKLREMIGFICILCESISVRACGNNGAGKSELPVIETSP